MKKKLFCVLCVLCFFLVPSNAQIQMPGSCTVYLPASLSKNVINEARISALTVSPYGQKPAPPQKTYWIAYSDRSNNWTFVEPNASSKRYSALSFNEKVTIAKIQDGFALVISDPKQDYWPNISGAAKVRGWIKLTNLLLWGTCPANRYGIFNKAVICLNADAGSIRNASVRGYLFKNPNESASGRLKADMKFYYVMKTEGDKSLLAHEYSLSKGVSDQMLYGWVDRSSFIPWSQRSCLEPTWAPSDVEYFSSNKIKANVSNNARQVVVDVSFDVPRSQSTDPFRYRMDPYLLRFPLLDGGDKTQYHCTAFANAGGHYSPRQNSPSESVQKLNSILESRQKINIGLVIDGTRSMNEYFDAAQKAIVEGCKYFSGKKIQVGAVIFRDFEDGDKLVQVFPMTSPSNPKFAEFLSTKGGYGAVSSARDKDMGEALYYGLNTALDCFKFNPKESNILLVVGDCGDNGRGARFGKSVSEQEIIDKMIQGRVSFMGFQVRNNRSEDFQRFNSQLISIMLKVTQGRYDDDRKNAGTTKTAAIQVSAREVLGGYDMQGSSNTNLYIGMYRKPDVNKGVMPVVELSALMENSFNAWNQSILKLQNDIVRLANEGTGNGGNLATIFEENPDQTTNPRIGAQAAALISSIGKDTYEAIAKTNSMFGIEGWTPRIDKTSRRQYYKPVVFIASDELNSLIEQLSPLYKVARSKSNSRVEFVNAIKALVRSILPGLDEKVIQEKGYDEIMQLISGMNEKPDALKYKIKDISDPDVVSQAQYLSIVNTMVRKYETLKNIQASYYPYSRVFSGIKYYWIPMEQFP